MSLFPQRTNVSSFISLIAKPFVSARLNVVLGVTLACGSGACAVAVVAHRKGLTDRAVTIQLDGGELQIDWRRRWVWMTGPTTLVFDGL